MKSREDGNISRETSKKCCTEHQGSCVTPIRRDSIANSAHPLALAIGKYRRPRNLVRTLMLGTVRPIC
jgi:hypothetical protein